LKIKIDENLPVEAAEWLNLSGHDAKTVFDQKLSGNPDTAIITICKKEERALITFDNDFSDIRKYPPSEYFGIIVLRLRNQSKNSTLKIIKRLTHILSRELVFRHLIIVGDKQLRIRS